MNLINQQLNKILSNGRRLIKNHLVKYHSINSSISHQNHHLKQHLTNHSKAYLINHQLKSHHFKHKTRSITQSIDLNDNTTIKQYLDQANDQQTIRKMANSKYEYVRENEDYLNKYLLNDCYTVIRIDGSKFHQFASAHHYLKPNDKRALDLMNQAALHVVKLYFPNIICAYGHSDEFSFILSKKSGLFNRRLNKLNSMIVSAFTSAFNFNWTKYFGNNQEGNEFNNNKDNQFKESIKLKYPPVFDSRCVLYTSDEEIKDYLKWRQVDCHVNNLYNTTFYALTGKYVKWYLDEQTNRFKAETIKFKSTIQQLTPQQAEKRLRGSVSKEKREEILKCMFSIEYENEMEQFRRGSLVVFAKKDDKLYNKWQECLIKKKKKAIRSI